MNLSKAERDLASELGISPTHVCVVGSTLICSAGNDVDFLCLVPSEETVIKAGFSPDTAIDYKSPLRSFRRKDQNIIATTDSNFFFAEAAIAYAAKLVASQSFNMTNRSERILFHSQIRAVILKRLVV